MKQGSKTKHNVSDFEIIPTSIERLKVYIEALLKANAGISELQARTMVYYGIATYYDEIDPFSILFIKNDFGCGKSDLIETLFPMCNGSEWIKGTTDATFRDGLEGCRTAFIDENENPPEHWLTKRFKRSNAKVDIKRQMPKGGFMDIEINLFGATVFAKRNSFNDGALNSRCLVIQPELIKDESQLAGCGVTNVGSLQGVVDELGEIPQVLRSGRAAQVWRPLEGIAKAFDDEEWLEWAKEEFGVDMEVIEITRMYEPREAVLMAVEVVKRSSAVESIDKGGKWYRLADLRGITNGEEENTLTGVEIGTILIRNGYKGKVKKYGGYPAVNLK